MAERKGTRRRADGAAKSKRRADVIDVEPADAASDKDEEDEEQEEKDEDGEGEGDAEAGSEDVDDDFLASAAEVIDVSADGEVSDEPALPAKKESNRGGSLVKRDPLAAYMSETRRYPLLKPDEEHTL